MVQLCDRSFQILELERIFRKKSLRRTFCDTKLVWRNSIKNSGHYLHHYEHATHLQTICLWNPAGNYMFKVNSRNTRARCEICSNLTIKIPEWRQWRRSGIFIVNSEYISHLVLLFLLLIWAGKCRLESILPPLLDRVRK